jgi:acetyltransferase-like isoleucine patch superfamily enzyme
MRQLLARLVRSPRTIGILLFDRLMVPQLLRLNGVKIPRGCRFQGHPVMTLARGAQIQFGNDVLVNSRFDSNPAGLPFPTIIAALGPKSRIAIGDGTGISGASIVARRSVTIGSRVLIGAGACIWDTDFHPIDPAQRREHQTRDAACSPVTIDDEVFIGARALILKGVRVGKGAVIGAGAVVRRDVKSGEIVSGNPARVVGSIDLKKNQNREHPCDC